MLRVKASSGVSKRNVLWQKLGWYHAGKIYLLLDRYIRWYNEKRIKLSGLAPIFPYTFYHLTHYWYAAADIPVANDIPAHYADAIRYNVRRPPQGSLPLLTRRAST